ncbi:disulfide bond formation protein DsbB [Litorivivens lipolytica]|uniref:Disulfide bond formation protein B n=1 Tax=Litorivivens lipolytica TaxID=1524264 RepID=A0A7W4W6R0_9GAMM|nr:disulfide bond formation protein B [Litorivivens lipolytica]MBB3048472.1 disulfide bond formation protein DsbB [Litorivivens lipolytica]
MPFSARQLYLAITLVCAALLGYALYTEYYLGLIPCALCMTQRFFYVCTGAVALIAAIHNPATLGRRIYSGLMVLASGFGAGVAGRQVWLQHLPEDQVPACGPSLEYILDTLPLADAFTTLMMGDGNCAEVQWTFLGQSMPTWSLIWFVILILTALVSLRAK